MRNAFLKAFLLMFCTLFFLILFAAFAPMVQAQTVPMYDVYEITLKTSQSYSDPFKDVGVTGQLSGPGGRSLTVKGFYDGTDSGEHVFKVRAAFEATGTWTYTISSSPSNSELSRCGSVTVTSAQSHGFIRPDPQHPYYFAFSDGTPFYPMGDTCYGMMTGISNSQRTSYLTKRSSQKFNFVRFFASGFPKESPGGTCYHPIHSSLSESDTWPWRGTRSSPDYDKLNPQYFQRLEGVLHELKDRGIYAEILVFNIYTSPFTESHFWSNTYNRDELWVKYLFARLAAYRTVFMWTVANEYETYPNGKYPGDVSSSSDVAWVKEMGNLFHDNDPYSHPTSAHPVMINPSIGDRFGSGDEMDVLSQQYIGDKGLLDWEGNYWDGPAAGIEELIWKDRKYSKPVINTESGYEWLSGYPTDFCQQVHSTNRCRRVAWHLFTAGAAGYAVGFAGTYQGNDEGQWKCWQSGSPTINLDFKIADMGLARQLGYYYDFITQETEFQKMNPAQSLVNSPNLCLANPGQEYIVYAPSGGTVQLDLRSTGNTFKVEWLNPRTGPDTSKSQVTGGSQRSFSNPAGDSNDWVLHLARTGDPSCTIPTSINSPSTSTPLTPGEGVAATGSGCNLQWSVDLIGDHLDPFASGSGLSFTFTVPADATSDQTLVIRLSGDLGTHEKTYSIDIRKDDISMISPEDGGWPRESSKIVKNGPHDYTIDADGHTGYMMVEIFNCGTQTVPVNINGWIKSYEIDNSMNRVVYVKDADTRSWYRINRNCPKGPFVVYAKPGTTRVASVVAFTYKEYADYIDSLSDPRLTKEVIATSGEGRYTVYRIRITNPGGSNKLKIGMSKPNHAYERSGYYMAQGVIEWLLSGDPAANLDNIEWTIYPVTGPQGIHDGDDYNEDDTLTYDNGKNGKSLFWDRSNGEFIRQHFHVLVEMHMWGGHYPWSGTRDYGIDESYEYNDPYRPSDKGFGYNAAKNWGDPYQSDVFRNLVAFWPLWYEFGADKYIHRNQWNAYLPPSKVGGALFMANEHPFYPSDDIDPRMRMRERGRNWARAVSQAYLRFQNHKNYWASSHECGYVDTSGAVLLPVPVINRLEDMTPASGSYKKNKNANNGTMKIFGEEYLYGIGMKGGWQVTYNVPPGTSTFRAMVGVDDASTSSTSSLEFVVVAEGSEVWRSSPLTKGDRQLAYLDISGANRITLELEGSSSMLGNWGGPRFTSNDPNKPLLPILPSEEGGGIRRMGLPGSDQGGPSPPFHPQHTQDPSQIFPIRP